MGKVPQLTAVERDEALTLLPDWAFFLATDLASLTTLFTDLTTARHRTWFPDLN